MSIDIRSEKLLSLNVAARMVPPSRNDRPVTVSCLVRWITKGVRVLAAFYSWESVDRGPTDDLPPLLAIRLALRLALLASLARCWISSLSQGFVRLYTGGRWRIGGCSQTVGYSSAEGLPPRGSVLAAIGILCTRSQVNKSSRALFLDFACPGQPSFAITSAALLMSTSA
jgi:hypothetical protein